MAIVKADAYGRGAGSVPPSKAGFRGSGCPTWRAMQIRNEGLDNPILILPIPSRTRRRSGEIQYRAVGVRPQVCRAAWGRSQSRRYGAVHVKLDTECRLGFLPRRERAAKTIEDIAVCSLPGLYAEGFHPFCVCGRKGGRRLYSNAVRAVLQGNRRA